MLSFLERFDKITLNKKWPYMTLNDLRRLEASSFGIHSLEASSLGIHSLHKFRYLIIK